MARGNQLRPCNSTCGHPGPDVVRLPGQLVPEEGAQLHRRLPHQWGRLRRLHASLATPVSAHFKTTCLGPPMVCAGHQGIAQHEALYITDLPPNISTRQLSCEIFQMGSAPVEIERAHLCQHRRRWRALGRWRRSLLRLAGWRRRRRGWLLALRGRCWRRRGGLGGRPPHGGWRRLFWRRQLHSSWRHKAYSICSNISAN